MKGGRTKTATSPEHVLTKPGQGARVGGGRLVTPPSPHFSNPPPPPAHYRIVSRSPTLGTLLLCTPTALPQKILPHLASFNSPVLGDPLHTHTLHLTTPRPLLHHSKLSLETPTETLTFTAPLPNDMTVGNRRDGLRDTEEVTAFREVNGEGDGVR